ncbi:MAG: replication-associated recombination protein A, partial [Lactimicrobium massiliense]
MEQQSLFDDTSSSRPLADRMRPSDLSEYIGQQQLLGKGKILRRMIETDEVQSMIFWGPPGTGKTTLARIIAHSTRSDFVNFSAVTSGIKEIRQVMDKAEQSRKMGRKTILFVDEIHRFNKAQQDAFLPYVERGSVILIGATTENPSFELNNALLSRCRVFVLEPLSKESLVQIEKHALTDERGFGTWQVTIDDSLLELIASYANGDARTALNTLELSVMNGAGSGRESLVTKEIVDQCIQEKTLLYDRNGEEHYNLISALHKSMRNSDADAAVYWLARMLEAGEDPLYIARRVVRFASEDIGMADSGALTVAINAYHACQFLGMPECSVHLTHAVVY